MFDNFDDGITRNHAVKLSLEALELVDVIARHGSFAAAAERLHKVPSTISYAVARLEEQLGLPVFVRNGPRVSLTEAGDELLREGRWLLAAARQLESRMRQIATGFEAELRLVHDSAIPTAAFIEDMRAFEALECGTRLRIGCDVMTGTWESLRDGRADLVVAAGQGSLGGGYQSVPVGSLAFAFCVAPGHPLAGLGRTISRADLLEHTAIVVTDSARGMTPRSIGVQAGQRRIMVPSMQAKIACQLAGLGHGFLPLPCVQPYLDAGELVALEVAEPRAAETFWLAWRTDQVGEALGWWRQRLQRNLVPDLLRLRQPDC